MRIHVINLNRSPARWAFMQDQARRLGLALDRVEAVEGDDLDPEAVRACPPDARGRRLTAHELACTLSHRLAWARIAAGSSAYGAVFEDDVHLAGDIVALLGRQDWIPADAAVVKLTANGRPVTRERHARAALGGRAIHRLLAPTVDAGGYVLSAVHARRLLAQTGPPRLPVDLVLMRPTPSAPVYQLVPGAAIQAKWADFEVLPGDASLVQGPKPPRPRTRPGPAKLGREAARFWSRRLRPVLLPLLQGLRRPEARVVVTPVAFRDAAPDGSHPAG